MAEPVKIPELHIYLNPAGMKVGDKSAYRPKAMVVDHDGYGWLDPTAPSRHDGDPNNLLVERVEGGVKIDFSKGDCCWNRVPTPQAKDGLEWLRVVEFIPGKASDNRGA